MSKTTVKCVHDFSYLIKEYDDGGFTARVREIPAVFVSNHDRQKLESEISEATRDYLKMFSDEHNKAKSGLLRPILESPKSGVVVEIKKFQMKC